MEHNNQNPQKNKPIFFIFKGKKKILMNIEIKLKTNEILKKYKCSFLKCHKFYNHKNKMIAHLRTHYGIKPFECSYCKKQFNEKGNLKTHIRIHTGERPFHCNLCSKSFKAFGQLKDHLTSHTGIKPFKCPICLKYYRRKGILKNHMLIHIKDNKIRNVFYFQDPVNEKKINDYIKNIKIKNNYDNNNINEQKKININNKDTFNNNLSNEMIEFIKKDFKGNDQYFNFYNNNLNLPYFYSYYNNNNFMIYNNLNINFLNNQNFIQNQFPLNHNFSYFNYYKNWQ
jgi:hypothetical protein